LASTPNPIHSWFLGPKAENDLLLKELIDFAFEAHVDWRRSYHPEDASPISASTQRTVAAISQRADLRREFNGLLQRLRESVPYFHPRYNAEMISDTSVVAQAGYFAAMMHNPNNASPDTAPVTAALEDEVAEQLATMIGYDTSRCWGHLTSGGTIANFESLWIARNMLYHPVAAMLATRALGIDISVTMPDKSKAPLKNLDPWELLNIRPAASLDLSPEQKEFAQSLRELLAAADVPSVARAWGAGDAGPGRALWQKLAATGLTGTTGPIRASTSNGVS